MSDKKLTYDELENLLIQATALLKFISWDVLGFQLAFTGKFHLSLDALNLLERPFLPAVSHADLREWFESYGDRVQHLVGVDFWEMAKSGHPSNQQ